MRLQRIDEIRSLVKQASGMANGNSTSFEDVLAAASTSGGPRIDVDNDPQADLILQAKAEGELGTGSSFMTEQSSQLSNGITHLPGARIELSDLVSGNATDQIEADWVEAMPSKGQPWATEIQSAAERYGLDPRLLASLVWSESGFEPAVTSHAGAIGLAQLMPATAESLNVNPWDPVQNLDGGARFLSQQIDRFGSIELALAAYNAGPGRVERAGGIPNIPETQAYVRVVIDRFTQLGGNR